MSTKAGKTTFERDIGKDILNKPIQELTIDEANKVSLLAEANLGIDSPGIADDANRLFTQIYNSGKERGWTISDDIRNRFKSAPIGATPPVTPTTPTIAPDIPEPGGLPIMSDFPTGFDETVEIMVRPDNWRRFANLPGIRSVVGKLNPSGVANSPVDKAAAGRARLRDDAKIWLRVLCQG